MRDVDRGVFHKFAARGLGHGSCKSQFALRSIADDHGIIKDSVFLLQNEVHHVSSAYGLLLFLETEKAGHEHSARRCGK